MGELGYYAHYQEPELGLLQLGVRFYDPEVGRFTQRDRVFDELSLFAYVGGNPLAYVDARGMAKCRVDPVKGVQMAAKCKCMYEVWTWYNAHRSGKDNWFPSGKVAHCWFTCKMIKYCGFTAAETAALALGKECYDCIDQTGGLKDVEMRDLIADADGGQIATEPNSDCLRDCKALWERGKRKPPPPPREAPIIPVPWPWLPDLPCRLWN